MDTKRVTNALLLVIAACLVLIVIKMYSSVDFIAEAQAQSSDTARMYGCYQRISGSTCDWLPIEVTAGGRVITSN